MPLSTTSTSASTLKPSFLSLPLEILSQILNPLLTPSQTTGSISKPLTIRSLFIRAHYRSVFMSQEATKNINTAILLVCQHLTALALPILYANPLWRAECRLDALASQIGRTNFARIRRLVIDVDDLTGVVECIVSESGRGPGGETDTQLDLNLNNPRSETATTTHHLQQKLSFANLHHLELPGYHAVALTDRASYKCRREALRLCTLARLIVRTHPVLDVLVQCDPKVDGGIGPLHGGADAVDLDLSSIRVKWRFCKQTDAPERNRESQGQSQGEEDAKGVAKWNAGQEEYIVDLDDVIGVLKWFLEQENRGLKGNRHEEGTSLAVDWVASGNYNQYPYLERQVRT